MDNTQRMDFKSYRSVLNFEFELKRKKNHGYSLRAFAKDLGLVPSQLSEIFSFKQGLSPRRAVTVGQRLGLKEKKLEWFCNLVEAEHAKSAFRRRQAQEKIDRHQNGVISESLCAYQMQFKIKWYHLAIRRMTLLKNFRTDAKWIARKIGISLLEAQQALGDLAAAGLVHVSPTGEFRYKNNVHFPQDTFDKDSARLLSQIAHSKSVESRELYDLDRRYQAWHVMTIDKKLFPELTALIRDFEDKLDHLTHKSSPHDELISVLLSAFPLTRDID